MADDKAGPVGREEWAGGPREAPTPEADAAGGPGSRVERNARAGWVGPLDVLEGRSVAAADGMVIKDPDLTHLPVHAEEWFAMRAARIGMAVAMADHPLTRDVLTEVRGHAADIETICADLLREMKPVESGTLGGTGGVAGDDGDDPDIQIEEVNGWIGVHSVDEARGRVSYPAMVRASYLEGTEGVRVTGHEELATAVAAAIDASPVAQAGIRSLPFVEDVGEPNGAPAPEPPAMSTRHDEPPA